VTVCLEGEDTLHTQTLKGCVSKSPSQAHRPRFTYKSRSLCRAKPKSSLVEEALAWFRV